MSKNKGFIKENPREKLKTKLFQILIIVGIILPFLILILVREPKIRFFADTIVFSSFAILISLIGLILVFDKTDKNIKFWIIIMCFLFFSIFFIKSAFNYYKDIPFILNSDYSYFEGSLTHYSTSGRGHTTTLIFGDKEFKIDYRVSPQFTVIGKRYSIEFLPNSKFVMSLKVGNAIDPLNEYLKSTKYIK